MLGRYITSFDDAWLSIGFSLLSAICVTAGYCFIGAAWLVMKTEGELQRRAAKWAQKTNILMAIGIVAVCITNLLVDQQIMNKWFGGLQILILIPITLLFVVTFSTVHVYLDKAPLKDDVACWYPFVSAIILFILCFGGLGYSFYPYIVPFKMTIFEAASARESLWVIFVGAAVVLPMIIGYTIYSYKVFWGKSTKLNY